MPSFRAAGSTRIRALRLIPLLTLLLLSGSVSTACGDSTGPNGCCRVCREGKPCGDSCIARDKQCNAGPGCACSG